MTQSTGSPAGKTGPADDICISFEAVKERLTFLSHLEDSDSISSEVCMITMNRILIVDDYAPYRDALRELLSQESDLRIVGEAQSVREALRSIGTLSPDLVLTDLAMPDARGIEAVTEIKRHYPQVKILVVSLHHEYEFKHWCRKAGAAGYLVKDAIYDQLHNAIRIILDGKTYVGADDFDDIAPDYVISSAATKENRISSALRPRH